MFASPFLQDISVLGGYDDSLSSTSSPNEDMREAPGAPIPTTLWPAFEIDPINGVDYVPPTPHSIHKMAAADPKMSVKRRTMRGNRRTQSPRPVEVEHPTPNRFAGSVSSSRADNHRKTRPKPESSSRAAKGSAPCRAPRFVGNGGDGHTVHASTHNEVEKKYRCRLNSSFLRLLEAVDSSDSGVISLYGDGDSDNNGYRNLSKGAVLDLASQRLLALKHQNEWLRDEVGRLKIALGMRCT